MEAFTAEFYANPDEEHPTGNTLNISDHEVKREGHCKKRKFSWQGQVVLYG